MMYPDDKGLTEQVRNYEDTLSVWDIIKNHFLDITTDKFDNNKMLGLFSQLSPQQQKEVLEYVENTVNIRG